MVAKKKARYAIKEGQRVAVCRPNNAAEVLKASKDALLFQDNELYEKATQATTSFTFLGFLAAVDPKPPAGALLLSASPGVEVTAHPNLILDPQTGEPTGEPLQPGDVLYLESEFKAMWEEQRAKN